MITVYHHNPETAELLHTCSYRNFAVPTVFSYLNLFEPTDAITAVEEHFTRESIGLALIGVKSP